LRLGIIVLIAVIAVGGLVILGLAASQKHVVPEISSQYEKLEIYKNELEKINQSNRQALKDLEERIKNSDDVHLEQINKEIAVIRKILDQNAAELDEVIKKLSQMESYP